MGLFGLAYDGRTLDEIGGMKNQDSLGVSL
jgi:hypothetical protein